MNLSVEGFFKGTDVMKINIVKANSDNFFGKLNLLIHLGFVIGIGVLFSLVFYVVIKNQSDSQEKELDDDISKKEDEAQKGLLDDPNSGQGKEKEVELKESGKN